VLGAPSFPNLLYNAFNSLSKKTLELLSGNPLVLIQFPRISVLRKERHVRTHDQPP
jgi:hypothetical protein